MCSLQFIVIKQKFFHLSSVGVFATFRVLIKMSDVFSGVTANTLGADLLTHRSSCSDFGNAAIFFLHKCNNISIDFGKNERAIILEGELAFFDGLERNGAAAVHTWDE